MPLRLLRYTAVENGVAKGVITEIRELIFSGDSSKELVGLGFLAALNWSEANQDIHPSFKPVYRPLYFRTKLAPPASMRYRPHAGHYLYASIVPPSASIGALEMRALLACDHANELVRVAAACDRHNRLGP